MKIRSAYADMYREEWARLYADESEASAKAAGLLREAGFRVITFPVAGTMGPEVRLGRQHYHGLDEIKQALKNLGCIVRE